MSEVVVTEHQEHVIKNKAYPEYIKSVLPGENIIPSHWRVVKAKRLFEFVTSGSRGWAEYYSDEGDLFFRITNLTRDSINPKLLSIKNVTPPKGAEGERSRIKDGDLLISITADLGSVCVANDQICGGYVSQHVALCRPCRDIGNFRWLGYVVVSNGTKEQLLGAGYGGTKVQLSLEDLKEFLVPVPPIEERNFIAAFLDYETARIDRLIAQQQRLIELLKEKRQAVISHAVTKGLNPNAPMRDSGVEWLGQVPEHWVVTALKRYWGVVDCKHITAEFIDDGIPLASIREVQSWEVDLSNAKQTSEEYYNALIDGGRIPENGDIIYSRNATVGEAARVTAEHPRFAMGQDVCLLKRIRKCIDTDFFMYQLKSRIISYQLDTLMVGSTFKRINVDDIRNFVVVVPPEDEAVAIRSYLNDFDRKYKNIEQSASRQVSLLQERRTALISAAVTGKIDLRGWTPPAEEVAA